MKVLDASAFIHDYATTEPTASVPQVRDELTAGSVYRFDAMEGAGMRLQLPDPASVARVQQAASASGDLATLSGTDVQLLAAALELGGVLVTDDYAMQNVADGLGLETEVIARGGIDEVRVWGFQCAGCGRSFDERHDRCPVCGAELTRKRPR